MGLPVITPGTGTREQAITDLIQSVALQETALAHILNAEGLKMQAVIGMTCTTPEQLFCLNESVNRLINAVSRFEVVMQSKLEMYPCEKPDEETKTTPAERELAKINVVFVRIDVPLYDPLAEVYAEDAAIITALTQINAGYSISFIRSGYDKSGVLTGAFVVTSDDDQNNAARDKADRTIRVLTSAVVELDKIHIADVEISVPLNDGLARNMAVSSVVFAAQGQISAGYIVSFDVVSYDSTTGLLTGAFRVTNTADPSDFAIGTEVNISVTYNAINVTDSASRAESVFISGRIAGIPLAKIAGIGGARAERTHNDTASVITDIAGLDLSILNHQIIDIQGISIPFGDILNIGIVNQFAQAFANGGSRAYAGAVSNDGIISIGGTSEFPSNAKLDLMKLIPPTPALSAANLSLGAITSAIHFDASMGDSIASVTDISNPVQGRAYDIMSAELNLASPLLGGIIVTANSAIGTLNNAVNGIANTAVGGLLNGLTSGLSLINSIVPGNLSLMDSTIAFNIDMKTAPDVINMLGKPLMTPNGSIVVNLPEGSATADLGKFLGGSLNNLPPNTPLLSSVTINKIIEDMVQIMTVFQSQLTELLNARLNSSEVSITGGLTLLKAPILGTPLAGLSLDYTGTLGDLLSGAKAIQISGSGTLALINPIVAQLTNLVQKALFAVINPLLFDKEAGGAISAASAAIGAALSGLSSALSPALARIADIASININVQEDDAGVFTETPVQISLLNGAVEVDLGKVSVGPNVYKASI